MSTMTAEVFREAELDGAQAAAQAKSDVSHESRLTAEVQQKVRQLARTLIANGSTEREHALVFGELGEGGHSSLWLVESVASAVGALLRDTVHVLAVAPAGADGAGMEIAENLRHPHASVQVLSKTTCGDEPVHLALETRLKELLAEGRTVFVHLPEAQRQFQLADLSGSVHGVVLLARAAHTRRAALESFQGRLKQAAVPLLGSVLLDRVHPVPARLYKLL